MYDIKKIKNGIINADSRIELKKFPENSIDLIATDPQYFNGTNENDIWDDIINEPFVRTRGGAESYIEYMTPIFENEFRILKEGGSLYHICNHETLYLSQKIIEEIGHRYNIILRNPICWYHPKMSNTKINFENVWSPILYLTKGGDIPTYNTTYNEEEFSALYSRLEKLVDSDNRLRYGRVKDLETQLTDSYIKSSKKQLKRDLLDDDVVIDFNLSNRNIFKKIGDQWYVPTLKGNSVESLKYPTQKPIKLFEIMIEVSSKCDCDDIVLDPFMGGGTSLEAAKKLKRNYIGIELSLKACRVAAKRINYPETKIINLPITEEMLIKMDEWEFQQWVCDKLSAQNTNPRGKDGASGADDRHDGIIQLEKEKYSSNILKEILDFDGCPIEAKHYPKGSVGIDPIGKLHSKMVELKKKNAILVGFNFSKSAYKLTSKFHNECVGNIYLIDARKLISIKDGDLDKIIEIE